MPGVKLSQMLQVHHDFVKSSIRRNPFPRFQLSTQCALIYSVYRYSIGTDRTVRTVRTVHAVCTDRTIEHVQIVRYVRTQVRSPQYQIS